MSYVESDLIGKRVRFKHADQYTDVNFTPHGQAPWNWTLPAGAVATIRALWAADDHGTSRLFFAVCDDRRRVITVVADECVVEPNGDVSNEGVAKFFLQKTHEDRVNKVFEGQRGRIFPSPLTFGSFCASCAHADCNAFTTIGAATEEQALAVLHREKWGVRYTDAILCPRHA